MNEKIKARDTEILNEVIEAVQHQRMRLSACSIQRRYEVGFTKALSIKVKAQKAINHEE